MFLSILKSGAVVLSQTQSKKTVEKLKRLKYMKIPENLKIYKKNLKNLRVASPNLHALSSNSEKLFSKDAVKN